MHDRHEPYPIEVLFEDHVILSDGRSKPHPVLLQLTSEALIVRRLKTTEVSSINNRDLQTVVPRNVTLKRHPITHSFGFSIKGGSDTGEYELLANISRMFFFYDQVFPFSSLVLSIPMHIYYMLVILFSQLITKISQL